MIRSLPPLVNPYVHALPFVWAYICFPWRVRGTHLLPFDWLGDKRENEMFQTDANLYKQPSIQQLQTLTVECKDKCNSQCLQGLGQKKRDLPFTSWILHLQ